jgi:pimeloyl-ACP methyl ester carboxylesterase
LIKDIVFIHGAWVTPQSWGPFAEYFAERGYRTHTPAWPGKASPVQSQQTNPSLDLHGLGMGEIVEHYQGLLKGFETPPVLVGHSFGGLFVQILLDRGFGSSGVAINPAPPKGVFAFYPSVFRSLGRVLLTWRGWKSIVQIPFSDFRFGIVNCLPDAEQRNVYDSQVVPETGRIFFQAALSMLDPNSPAKVHFANPNRGPLLIVAGGSDHIVPEAVNRSNHKAYQAKGVTTDFMTFPGRCHWTIGQPGWEEVAGAIGGWLSDLAG